MKAWSCMNYSCPCGYIVFAETRSQAKSMVMGNAGFESVEWIDSGVSITRIKDLDGKKSESCILDWHTDARIYYEAGWWPEEGAPFCDECGLYEYDEFPESYISETEEAELCAECIRHNATEGVINNGA